MTTPEFELKSMNGRLTVADVLQQPPKLRLDPPKGLRTLAESSGIVSRALEGHFTLGKCSKCEGVEIYSKIIPLSWCTRCDTRRNLEEIKPVQQQYRCRYCKCTFYAVVKYTACLKCQRKKPKAKIEPNPTKINRSN